MTITENLSENEFYREYLKNLRREQIEISSHGLKRANKRHIGIEESKDFLTERFHKSINKNDDGEFEIIYDSPEKTETDNIVIIVVPIDSNSKIIRVVTVYKQ
jgi:hypothetical protein